MTRSLISTMRVVPAILLFAAGVAGAAPSPDVGRPAVANYVGIYTEPPTTVGSLDPGINAYRIPDGPLMGNGDIAVAVGGTATEQTFYLSKSDLSQTARGVGGLTFSFEGPAGDPAGYRQEEDLYRAEVRSVIPLAHCAMRMRSWVSDDGNVLVTDVSTSGDTPADVGLRLWSHPGKAQTRAAAENGLLWATRQFSTTVGTTRQPFDAAAAMVVRVMGQTPAASTNSQTTSTLRFTIPVGKAIRVILSVAGGYQAKDPVAEARSFAESLTDGRIDQLSASHLQWWKQYWSKSSISIGNEPVEKFYYGAQYVLGCASRAGSVAPGLAGPWHLNGPICWSNKYTLDYNFEAPWWGVYSSNRADLAMPYYDVILKLIPAGRRLAKEHGTKGILFGVNAHAWGGFTDTRTLNMKGDASLASLNFMMHYQYTRDPEFLVQKAWPLLKGLAEFWEDNLVRDNSSGKWVIHDSGEREGQQDENAISDLAYVRRIFQFLLQTAGILEGRQSQGETIHISDSRMAKWQNYVGDLSPFPTMDLDGKRVFKEAENRVEMSLGGAGDNSDVLDAVFPGEALSLSSSPQLLQIAQNTVAALNPDTGKDSWFQANSFPKIYTQAVRSGYPAAKVIEQFKQLLAGRQPYDDRGDHVRLRDNLTIVPPAHSLESVGAIEAINSMLLQSQDDVIRVFPNWIKDRNASFHRLAAHGAFLVSSEYRNGAVTSIDITSGVGGACMVWNPWKGKTCEVNCVSGPAPAKVDVQTTGGEIVFPTRKGLEYSIRPGAERQNQ